MRIRRSTTIALLLGLLPLAAAAGSFEQSISARPGGTLQIRLDSGSIEVESHDEHEVRVDAHWSGSAEFKLQGDGEHVELVGKSGGWAVFGNPRVRVHVRIPERYSLDVKTQGGSIEMEEVGGSVHAETNGGEIELDGAQGPAQLRTSGGSIRAYEVWGELFAHTSGGTIRVSEASGPITVQTSGGNIHMDDVSGPLEARTSGGSISARFEESPSGLLETSGGSIEAELPEDAGVHLKAHTSGGRVEVDAEILIRGVSEPGQLVGDIHGGGPTLQLLTSGGNIRVRVR